MFDLKAKLQKTREGFVSPLRKIFQRGSTLGDEDQESIEELLLGSDIGVEASEHIMDLLREQRDFDDPREFLREELIELLSGDEATPRADQPTPRALLIVGVNGVGKIRLPVVIAVDGIQAHRRFGTASEERGQRMDCIRDVE